MSALVLIINGEERRIDVPPDENLLSVLRNELKLTGTKYGCGEGQCGACTVLIDGKPVRSCTTAVSGVIGKKITTIEGLAQNGRLHPVQEAFLRQEAFQCGYCTPGMILSAVGLLSENADPSEADIIRYMNMNICRCGSYARIVTAVRSAAQAMRKGVRS
ncbi:MAG TPA: (2Fe-2S)-binding protein [Terriglobales bacterium]|nr:(2Fe-2S)-binding protein [Terriglobales bacterium]